MKIKCLNCKSAYLMIALKGDKTAVPPENKVTTRCPMCCDILAYTAHDVPKDEQEKDRLRVIVMHDHLWPRASTFCGQGRKDAKKMLQCPGCEHVGAIDAKFCALAQGYNELLVKAYPGDEKPDDGLGVDDDADLEPGELSRPIGDYYMGEDDA